MATIQSKHGRKYDEEFKREVAALASHGALGFYSPVDFENQLN